MENVPQCCTRVTNPVSYGWKLVGEVLEIDWMDCKPAPEEVNIIFFCF